MDNLTSSFGSSEITSLSETSSIRPDQKYRELIDQSASYLKAYLKCDVDCYVILGSGLDGLTKIIEIKTVIPFDDIPHFPTATVQGHQGRYLLGEIEGKNVLFQEGRLHYYEGVPPPLAVFPVQVGLELGIKNFVITNAVGSLSTEIHPGSIVILTNLLAGQMPDPFIEVGNPQLGTLFSDCTEPFDSHSIEIAEHVLSHHEIDFVKGTFAWMQGPRYDSAAEIADLRARAWVIEHILKQPLLAPKVVGMSMAPEVVAINHYGNVSVLGLSFVSNFAAGLSSDSLEHEKVLLKGKENSVKLSRALFDIVREITL